MWQHLMLLPHLSIIKQLRPSWSWQTSLYRQEAASFHPGLVRSTALSSLLLSEVNSFSKQISIGVHQILNRGFVIAYGLTKSP